MENNASFFNVHIFKTSWMQCLVVVVVYGSIYKLTDVVAHLIKFGKKGRHIEVFLNGVVGMESRMEYSGGIQHLILAG